MTSACVLSPSSSAASVPSAPRLLSLFSGIGGFELGLERAGFETVAQCEVNPKCRHLLQHHWPHVRCYDDVQTLTGDRLRADGVEVDAICGGFPCQDLSFAGTGAGLAGERSGLWREYARLVRELRPRLVFVENVSALLVRGMGTVLGDLAALGYGAWWDCIPASAVGAPHRRDRLWIVAYARGLEHQGYGPAFRRAIAAGLPQAAVADPARLQPGRQEQRAERERVGASGQPIVMADASSKRRDGCGRGSEPTGWRQPTDRGWWLTEPNVGRVAHGVPARVDRLHGLGNAVVPEIPYRLGRAALAALDEIQAERAAA